MMNNEFIKNHISNLKFYHNGVVHTLSRIMDEVGKCDNEKKEDILNLKPKDVFSINITTEDRIHFCLQEIEKLDNNINRLERKVNANYQAISIRLQKLDDKVDKNYNELKSDVSDIFS